MVLTGDDVKFIAEIETIRSSKREMVSLITLMGVGTRSDEKTCEMIIEIAEYLEKIVKLIKKNPKIPKISEVRDTLRDVTEFSEALSTIVRSRSWHGICQEFSPQNTLEQLKKLKSVLTRSDKKDKGRVKSPTVTVPSKEEGSSLVDDDSFLKYKNRVNRNINDPLTENEQFLIDRDIRINGSNMTNLEKQHRRDFLKIQLRTKKITADELIERGDRLT